jgi:hypothetical protein
MKLALPEVLEFISGRRLKQESNPVKRHLERLVFFLALPGWFG